jgi:aryl-alcohol dehydrogenase-like predicted oxidoreductase
MEQLEDNLAALDVEVGGDLKKAIDEICPPASDFMLYG